MQLCEAIRLGAMLRPQAFRQAFSYRGDHVVGSCALAAAHEALGGSFSGCPTPLAQFETLFATYVRSPCRCTNIEGRRFMGRLDGVITHLNDDDHWTREQIADWVETLESGADTQQAVACGALTV